MHDFEASGVWSAVAWPILPASARCSRRPVGDAMRYVLHVQGGASHSEAATENERVTRVELATFSLATRRSTTELHPQFEKGRENNVQLAAQRNPFNCWDNLEIVESK
jgi:hypothetical protein